jgi:hypothetical protein
VASSVTSLRATNKNAAAASALRVPPPAPTKQSSPQFDSNMRCLAHPPSCLIGSAGRWSAALTRNASDVFDEMPHPVLTSPVLRRSMPLSYARQVIGRTRGSGLCTVARESAHELAGPDPSRFTVVPGDAAVEGSGADVSEAAERVCRVVCTQPEPKIASALEALRVAVSPELVAEVLKNLSNAGMLALAFFRWAERQEGFRYTSESFHNLIESLGKIK